MRSGIGAVLVLVAVLALFAPAAPFQTSLHALAQDPPPVPDLENLTSTPAVGPESLVIIVVHPENAYAEIEENSQHLYQIRIDDISPEGSSGAAPGAVRVDCYLSMNETMGGDVRSWGAVQPVGPLVQRGDSHILEIPIVAGFRPAPELFLLDVQCVAGTGAIAGRVLAEFTLATRVKEYSHFSLEPQGAMPPIRPDTEFEYRFVVRNNGNYDKVFKGSVEGPPGWTIQAPTNVFVRAGDVGEVVVKGRSPQEKVWYSFEAGSIEATYWPEGFEEKAQSQRAPVQVHGFFLHPALVPLVTLGLLSLFLMLFLLAFARRALEEQVLGKPVPPWRLPVERAYLKELEQTDPDEFYIVRYYLMVEEHRSALLWYDAYKRATRKDRKRERVWVKQKSKVDRKTARLERKKARLLLLAARAKAGDDRKWSRRLAAVERRLMRRLWREQRGLLKIHAKSVRRIDRVHRRRAKLARQEHEKSVKRELRRVAKENKERAKRGEDPLPAPPQSSPEIPGPVFPDVVEVPISPVSESVFAQRLERVENARLRAAKRREGRPARRRAMQQERLEARIEARRASLPPEPTTHLYDVDAYLDPAEVVVEDDRPLVARLLRLPTLEEREHLRRRRTVFAARLKSAKERGDNDEMERLRREWAEEKRRLREARRTPIVEEDAAAGHAATQAEKERRLHSGREAPAAAVREEQAR